MTKWLTLITFFSIISLKSYAYPQFIGKGYHNCKACHYNPFGNGPLTDYGRGVAASSIAGHFMIPNSVGDESLGEHSSIIFGSPANLPIDPSIDYRGLYLQTGLQQENQPDPAWMNMQAELSLSGEFGVRKQFIVTASYNTLIANSGITPNGDQPRSGKPAGEDLSYLREYYVGYKINQETGVYLGKTDKVYGIRIPDHNLSSRRSSRNNQYASSPGIVIHHGTDKYDAGFQYFVEDETEDANEKAVSDAGSGIATKFDYSITSNWRLGVSYLNETEKESKTKYDAKAFHAKTRVGEGSSVMFEYGLVDTTPDGDDPTTSQYIFLQSHMYLQRGLYFVTTYDQFSSDLEEYNETHSFGPGVQWFPLQRFELRADLLNSKSFSSNGASKDTWMFLGQVHLWL